jgi:two-component system, OmpR family, sensor histidine kinase KdpD
MLESAARNRDRFHGELIAVTMKHLERSPEQKKRIEGQLQLAREKNAETVTLEGDDVVDAILNFARQRGITQIYVGHKGRESFWERAFGTALDKLIAAAEGMDVRVFPHT